MLFSVLMAHYNNAKYLDASINSVLKQTYKDWEIILIDDGSVDDFEIVAKKYVDHQNIKIFRNEENKGCSYTKWRCAKEATGELAGFLDPDDTLHPDALAIMVEAHQQKPECSIVNSTHYICDNKLNVLKLAEYPKSLPLNTPYLLVNDGSIHHFASFKKSCYDRTVGITPERKFDKATDQDLYYLLEEQGDVYFIDKPLYYYRVHDGSISNAGNEALAMKTHFQIVEQVCLQRIEKLKSSQQPDAKYWIKRYRTRYYKIKIFNSFRRKQWFRFLSSLSIYPFVGGMPNLISYFKKLPKERGALIKKSFVENYNALR